MRKVLIVMSFLLSVFLTTAQAENYNIDSVHTTIGFTVKHMTVSNVTGSFDKFEGKISYDPKNIEASTIEVNIDASSVNTRNEKRDAHLRTADFFDVQKFPTIKFVSKKVTDSQIVGDLTMKGVTKEVVIPATITGPVNGMMGVVIGVNGSLTINRQDFGVNFNKTLDQGGLAISNDVVINISVEASKEEAVAKK